jgi:hypothetical protein
MPGVGRGGRMSLTAGGEYFHHEGWHTTDDQWYTLLIISHVLTKYIVFKNRYTFKKVLFSNHHQSTRLHIGDHCKNKEKIHG